MPIRDLLQAQVEQMGKALGKLLADVLHSKATDNLTEVFQECNEAMGRLLKIDIDKFVALPYEELRVFTDDNNLTEIHLETISYYLSELAEHQLSMNDNAHPTIQKAIELLDLANEVSQTFSIDRMEQKHQLNTRLKTLR